MTYHASTWPLILPPQPAELLSFLRRDYGIRDASDDVALAAALLQAGHPFGNGDLFERVRGIHSVRRYEARTGLPF